MTAKGIVIYIVARVAKSSKADAIDRAVLMAQGGEFAFVLYATGASQGVIDGSEFEACKLALNNTETKDLIG